MATKKDVYDGYIGEFKNAKQKQDEEIAELESLWLVWDELESKKRKIVDAFLQKTRGLRSDPKYQEAMKSRHRLITAEKKYFALKKDYEEEIVDSFEEWEKIEEEAIEWESETLFKWGEKTEVEKKIQNTEEIPDEIMWDEDKIIAYIKNRFIDIEENINYMWFNWKKIHLNLPVIWDFEWFKFNAFVSSSSMSKADFDLNQNLEEKSYSKDEICGLLSAINKFMATCGVCTDGDMNYKNQLKYRKTGINKCKAWDCLKNMLDLSRTYFLNGKNVSWRRKSSRAIRHCLSDRCYINRYNWDKNCAYLLLKSDN